MGSRNINGRSPQEVQSPYFFSLHPKTCADDDRRNIQETYKINAQRSEVTTNEVGACDAVQGSLVALHLTVRDSMSKFTLRFRNTCSLSFSKQLEALQVHLNPTRMCPWFPLSYSPPAFYYAPSPQVTTFIEDGSIPDGVRKKTKLYSNPINSYLTLDLTCTISLNVLSESASEDVHAPEVNLKLLYLSAKGHSVRISFTLTEEGCLSLSYAVRLR